MRSRPARGGLAELRDTIAQGAVTCIFPEVQHDPALVAQMAEDTGITLGRPLDPSGSTLSRGRIFTPS